MSQPYVGEIRMFGGNFAPAGWAFCNGALISISENETLFNLIGTTYGGDGQETFALPDLQGRIPIHAGQGPSISQNYQLGEKAGVESVTLSTQQIPTHNHGGLLASNDPSNSLIPTSNVVSTPLNITPYFAGAASVPLNASSLQPVGGSQPHDNMIPFLVVSFIISLYGIFPSQT
jgi:microcystin-dependent protein